MSTSNAQIIPMPLGDSGEVAVTVVFTLRNGSTRSYIYVGSAAEAILSGSDPKNYSGQRIA